MRASRLKSSPDASKEFPQPMRMAELETRLAQLELERKNWTTFQSYFESQLKHFLINQHQPYTNDQAQELLTTMSTMRGNPSSPNVDRTVVKGKAPQVKARSNSPQCRFPGQVLAQTKSSLAKTASKPNHHNSPNQSPSRAVFLSNQNQEIEQLRGHIAQQDQALAILANNNQQLTDFWQQLDYMSVKNVCQALAKLHKRHSKPEERTMLANVYELMNKIEITLRQLNGIQQSFDETLDLSTEPQKPPTKPNSPDRADRGTRYWRDQYNVVSQQYALCQKQLAQAQRLGKADSQRGLENRQLKTQVKHLIQVESGLQLIIKKQREFAQLQEQEIEALKDQLIRRSKNREEPPEQLTKRIRTEVCEDDQAQIAQVISQLQHELNQYKLNCGAMQQQLQSVCVQHQQLNDLLVEKQAQINQMTHDINSAMQLLNVRPIEGQQPWPLVLQKLSSLVNSHQTVTIEQYEIELKLSYQENNKLQHAFEMLKHEHQQLKHEGIKHEVSFQDQEQLEVLTHQLAEVKAQLDLCKNRCEVQARENKSLEQTITQMSALHQQQLETWKLQQQQIEDHLKLKQRAQIPEKEASQHQDSQMVVVIQQAEIMANELQSCEFPSEDQSQMQLIKVHQQEEQFRHDLILKNLSKQMDSHQQTNQSLPDQRASKQLNHRDLEQFSNGCSNDEAELEINQKSAQVHIQQERTSDSTSESRPTATRSLGSTHKLKDIEDVGLRFEFEETQEVKQSMNDQELEHAEHKDDNKQSEVVDDDLGQEPENIDPNN